MEPIRFGVLGAARIVRWGIVAPARVTPGVSVELLGAREEERARQAAAALGIPRSCAGYESVISDPAVTAVYVPLPNSLHLQWAQRALEAGKDVLCEKPLACNADEAQRLSYVAAISGRVLMEAFHWRYHPLAERMIALATDPDAGPIQRIRGRFRTPMLRRQDIRFDYALGGGAAMDLGCYVVNMMRVVTGEEPEVEWAQAQLIAPEVDKRMRAHLRFPGGAVGELDCELAAQCFPQLDLTIECAARTIGVANPVLPQIYHHITVIEGGRRRVERLTRTPTYTFQLAAFATAVRGGAAPLSDGADGVRNMRVVDALYRAAGLSVRGAAV